MLYSGFAWAQAINAGNNYQISKAKAEIKPYTPVSKEKNNIGSLVTKEKTRHTVAAKVKVEVADTTSIAKSIVNIPKNHPAYDPAPPKEEPVKADSCKGWCRDAKCTENKRNYLFTDNDGHRVYKELHSICTH